MGKGKKKNSSFKEDSSNLFIEEVVVMPYEKAVGREERMMLSDLVTRISATTDQWNSSWKKGHKYFERLLPLVMKVQSDHLYSTECEEVSKCLSNELNLMKQQRNDMESLCHNASNVIERIVKKTKSNVIISTMTDEDFKTILLEILRCYTEETRIKEICCKNLTNMSNDSNTWNALLARWNHHSYLSSYNDLNLSLVSHELTVH